MKRKIKAEDIIYKYGEELLYEIEDIESDDVLYYLDELETKIAAYEKYINRLDISRDVMKNIPAMVIDTLISLTDRFKVVMENNDFVQTTSHKCKSLNKCKADECALYFYGDKTLGYLYDEDPDLFL